MSEPLSSLRVIIFGGSGMVGAGILNECLGDSRVTAILSVGRSSSGFKHPKLQEIIAADLNNLEAYRAQFQGYDACFFVLGVSSVGLSEEAYRKISCDLTFSVARFLISLNPQLAFTYVSGVGTDSSETGKTMWARVKGHTENELLKMPFRSVVMFRLGGLIPLKGYRSKTRLYRILYIFFGPLFQILAILMPKQIMTPQRMGRAMIAAGLGLSTKAILEPPDIYALGQ
jgi:uncharacterized protein YbjT (DUF2867 family)